jgi:diguanylate cyclase (GGDEF)-like protein/PAS domain S-box-containing protein
MDQLPESTPVAGNTNRGKPTILLVDDESFYLDVLTHCLEQDYQLINAQTGESAIKQSRAQPVPDLILLDIMLPDMDGFEVCRQLKKAPITRDIPVLFVTILDDSFNESEGFKAGAEDYIAKPLSPDIVRARVKTHLALHQAHQALEAQNRFLASEIKRQTQELEQTHNRLKQTRNLGKLGSWELDLVTGDLFWSEEVFEMFQRDPETFKPSYDAFLQTIHPDDREMVNQAYQQSITDNTPYAVTHRVLIDDQIRYFEERGNAVRDSQGAPLRSMGTVQDISSRVKLEAQNNRFNHLVNQSPDGIFIINAEDARVVDANQAACSYLGYRRKQLLQMHLWDFSTKINSPDTWNELRPHLAASQGKPFEAQHRHRDGHLIPVELTVRCNQEQDGEYFIAIARDITRRKQAEQQILESSQIYSAVISSTKDGYWVIDPRGRLLEANQSYCQLSGYSEQELTRMHIWQIDINESSQDVEQRIVQISQRGSMIFETEHRRKDGSIWPVEVSVSYSPVQGGRVFVFLRDITERRESEKQIQYMAYYDLLTGLPNRQLLADRMQQAIAQTARSNSRLAICYIDLDGFKSVNDRHGHDVGDQLLVELSQRLLEDLREGDTLARIGGDEFILMLNRLNSEIHAEEIAQRILDSIARPFEVASHRFHISGSIGITVFPRDNADPDTLLRHADHAMYSAKQNGRNRYKLYDPCENEKIDAQRQAISEFAHALRNSQLVLYYQPRIELDSAKPSSVEALVRWQHPQQGLLPPARFLPAIKDSPLEIELGEWVLKTALDQHMVWRDQGLTLPVSVNISPRHIQQSSFPEFLKTLLADYPDNIPGQLELEVLETSAIGDTVEVASIMQACIDLGVSFALDDFGTGYSSLAHFHRLPINILKIDQHFVRNMLVDPRDRDIVEGVLILSRNINRPVVAEGVESIEHGLILLQMGCQYAQGYGIARPMPAESVVDWWNSWQNERCWQELQTTGEPLPP